MDSNVKKDVELAKKSCEKARELIKSKRNAALALLASIGICLALVVVTFVLGSLFGYYLANLQMLQIEQNVVTVKEDNIETNHTIGGMQKLVQQLGTQVKDNQTTTISTTTQISTTTSTTTAEDLTERRPHFKIRISFDNDENEETEKENVDPKKDQMDEIMPIWNEIFDTLEPLEPLEPLDPLGPLTRRKPRKLIERIEPNVKPITSTTSATTTDEDLPYFKISFDSDENEETEKPNVVPKEDDKIDEKIPSWNEILETLGTLEQLDHLEELESDDDVQPISTSTTNPEDLTQTEFDYESIVMNPVFKPTETLEPQDYHDDNADDDDEEADAVQESVSQKPNETTTQNPNTPRTTLRMDHLLAKYNHFVYRIHFCQLKLSRKCSAPAQQQVVEEQQVKIWSILYGAFPDNESEAQYVARIQNWTHQLDATIERIVSTPVDLCAGHDDYAECQSCVKRNANCYFMNRNICNTPDEWNLIGYTPIKSMADDDLCYHHPVF